MKRFYAVEYRSAFDRKAGWDISPNGRTEVFLRMEINSFSREEDRDTFVQRSAEIDEIVTKKPELEQDVREAIVLDEPNFGVTKLDAILARMVARALEVNE